MHYRFRTVGLRIFLLTLLASACVLLFHTPVAAQQSSKTLDSIRVARQRSLDSAKTARQHTLDSAKASRDAALAIQKAAQKKRTDSLAAIRKYKESKKYQDSVTKSRQARVDAMKAIQQARIDSMKLARQHVTDSMTRARTAITTALKAAQKKRTDSLGAIRKYRESKRYSDSVAVVRKTRLDSLKLARKEINDSATAARKRVIDSATAARKLINDSTIAVRKKYMDSVKVVRKAKSDSLAVVKAAREKAAKQREKDRVKKMELAVNIKIQKKREAWSNEKMLKKSWSTPRKVVQNTFTRYNYYFNADRRMDDALLNMQRMKRESYDTLLALYPFDPDLDSMALKPDMDSIIQKASVGIQIHDPRTKWGDDLYLLLGQAFYYKGDYVNAATAFRYIVSLRELEKKNKEKNKPVSSRNRAQPSIVEADKKGALDFLKHQAVHNEALLWLAHTYTEANKIGEAESVLDLLIADPNFPESLKGRYALEKAYLDLEQHNYRSAAPNLFVASNDESLPSWLRIRAAFLTAQLYQEQGKYKEAAERYEKVVDLHPKIDMDFYARKNIAYSMMSAGGKQEDAVASLKAMLKDGKYLAYYEQVYYVLGRLEANGNNTAAAETYLRKGLNAGRTTRKQRALSFAALGDVYYTTGNYVQSKLSYDSAAILGGRENTDPIFVNAAKRSKSLDAVAAPSNTIHTQDSLLALAAMSEKDQRAAIRKYIRTLEQRMSDSIARAESGGPVTAALPDGAPGEGTTSWYFSNPTLVQQGYNEFKRKWGNRTLADNWRRAAAAGAGNFAGAVPIGTEPSAGAAQLDERGLPTEESLLAGIPKTTAEQEASKKLVRRAYVDLASAYVKQLEDYPRATKTLDDLDRRFAGHEYQAEALYLGYLTFLRQNQTAKAQSFANQLMQQYPATEWAALVRPASANEDGSGALASNASVAGFYDETYGLMQQRQFAEVLRRSRDGQRQYPDPRYTSRFQIMEAMALAGSGDYNRADTVIGAVLGSSPTDTLRIWAETVKTYINNNKPKDTTRPNVPYNTGVIDPGSIPEATNAVPANGTPIPATSPVPGTTVPAVADSSKNNAANGNIQPLPTPADAPKAFTYKPQDEHLFIFAFPKMEPRAMGVKAATGDFNTLKFSGQPLAVSAEMLSAQQGFVVVRGFSNAAKAKIYLNTFRGTSVLFREYKAGEYKLFSISAENYKKLIADRSIQPYLTYYKAHYPQ